MWTDLKKGFSDRANVYNLSTNVVIPRGLHIRDQPRLCWSKVAGNWKQLSETLRLKRNE